MKLFFSYILFLVGLVVTAQSDHVIHLKSFHTLKVYNGLQVTLVKSKEPSCRFLNSFDKDEIVIKEKKGVLRLRRPITKLLNRDKPSITIYYTSTLHTIDVNEGASVTSIKKFDRAYMSLFAQERSKIMLSIDAEHLNAKVVSGSAIHLNGSTKSQLITARTGGNYEAEALKSKKAIVSASLGAEVSVLAKKYVKATVSSKSIVHLHENPEALEQTLSLGGKVLLE